MRAPSRRPGWRSAGRAADARRRGGWSAGPPVRHPPTGFRSGRWPRRARARRPGCRSGTPRLRACPGRPSAGPRVPAADRWPRRTVGAAAAPPRRVPGPCARCHHHPRGRRWRGSWRAARAATESGQGRRETCARAALAAVPLSAAGTGCCRRRVPRARQAPSPHLPAPRPPARWPAGTCRSPPRQ